MSYWGWVGDPAQPITLGPGDEIPQGLLIALPPGHPLLTAQAPQDVLDSLVVAMAPAPSIASATAMVAVAAQAAAVTQAAAAAAAGGEIHE